MHPDLSSHLHTPECNELISQLKECHETKKFQKFLGACSDIDRLVQRCLKKELADNRKKNFEQSKINRQKVYERMRQEEQAKQ
ncbi:COX assembly mitochondrial protein 2 homolog [Chironomus tepperi]|uniref:COX assembly mitochondrial protein 2 homolog n=1 Tax=Chironomus tepperi TaxID=113505 RepID=UPI00391FBCC0